MHVIKCSFLDVCLFRDTKGASAQETSSKVEKALLDENILVAVYCQLPLGCSVTSDSSAPPIHWLWRDLHGSRSVCPDCDCSVQPNPITHSDSRCPCQDRWERREVCF